MRSLFLSLIIFCLFSAALQAQTATAPSVGVGTIGNPYQIATLENLYWITQNSSTWSSYFIQTANINASATSGWNSGAGMPPIGTGSAPWFTGSYDGQGRTIYGLFINKSASYAGLFAYLYLGGSVKNVGLVNANISGANYVGGIAGANGGTITNCFVTGNVSGNQNGSWYIGGLVGENYTNIDSCYSSAAVLGNSYIGGLAGASRNSAYHIANSFATGQVNSNANGYSKIGGLVGALTSSGNIVNCYATGFIYGIYETGGLVGYTDGSAVVISNSFWDTQTTGRATSSGGTGKTTAEMKTSTTFTAAGWNFTAPWGINASWNNGYPYLRSLVTAPSISSVTPSMNGRNISTSSNIEIVFNQSMNGSSMVLNSSIRIDGSHSGRHSGSLSYNSGTYTATIDPSVNFTAGEVVTVTVTAQVTNAGSIPMAARSVWNFTIATSASEQFAGKADYATGTFPIDVIAADLDGDGDLDIAAPNQTVHTVSILLNTGSGSFGAKTDYATEFTPRTVAAGDLDRNGSMDLVVTNSYSATISVLLNNGSGTFAAAVSYAAGANTDHVLIADLNGDGFPDIAATAYNDNNVSVYINNGNGMFASRVTYAAVGFTVAISSADVDGDKDLDLIIGNYESTSISVLRNNGSGAFGAAESYTVGANSIYTAVADLDADGDVDIAVVNRSANSVTILKNNGSGTFGSSATYATGVFPFAISAGDVDGDGDIDLAVSSQNSTTFSILKNNGTGNFSTKVDYAATAGTLGICLADLNQDGDMDVITTNATVNSISVWRNTVTPVVVSTSPSMNGALPSAASNFTVTFNTDMNAATFTSGTTVRVTGSQTGFHSGSISYSAGTKTVTFDPAVNFSAGEVVEVSLTTGITSAENIAMTARKYWRWTVQGVAADTLAPGVSYAVREQPEDVTFADLDSDGDRDMIVANYNAHNLSVMMNYGNGTFSADERYGTATPQAYPPSVTSADLDGDGDMDLLAVNSNYAYMSVILNNGNGTFTVAVDYATGNYPCDVAVADVDGDGDADAVVANYLGNTISVLKNNGNGTFSAKTDYASGNNPYSILAADLDADGDMDIAAAGYVADAASVLMNNGDGTFAARTDYPVGDGASSIAAADIDGDGDLDLGLANSFSGTVSILKNNGNGTFAAKTDYTSGTSPRNVIFSDVDGDGDQDMLSTNAGSYTLSLLKNNGGGAYSDAVNYTTGSTPIGLAATDMDGDGDIDIAVTNAASNTVWIFKGSTFAALPVELVSFTAAPKKGGVELNWKTATEVDNYGFEVERKEVSGFTSQVSGIPSSNLKPESSNEQWIRVGFVNGNGSSNITHDYSFTDNTVSPGKYAFRLKQIDRDGKFEYSQEVEVNVAAVPNKLMLEQNYPNPFNPSTTIQFVVPITGKASLKIFNALGQEVATLFDGIAEAGHYEQAAFNASHLASGIYLAKLTFGGQTQIKKLLLVK